MCILFHFDLVVLGKWSGYFTLIINYYFLLFLHHYKFWVPTHHFGLETNFAVPHTQGFPLQMKQDVNDLLQADYVGRVHPLSELFTAGKSCCSLAEKENPPCFPFIILVELQSNYCLNVSDKDEIWRKVCDSARSISRKCCDTISTGSKRVTTLFLPLFCLHPLSTYPLISVVTVAEKKTLQRHNREPTNLTSGIIPMTHL